MCNILVKSYLCRILQMGSVFLLHKEQRQEYRKRIKEIVWSPTNIQLRQINRMTDKETIEYIIQNKCSIARYGDGEIGYLLFDNFKHFFQPHNKLLQKKLKYILDNPIDSCVIGIPFWMANKAKCDWDKCCHLNYFDRFWPLLKKKYKYAAANCFGINSLNNGNLQLLKKIWEDRDILLITGEKSTFIWDERLFNNIKSVEFIYTKAVDAFSEYDKIIDSIELVNTDKNKLILISLGLTATVLAYDLSIKGYQAIDIGHITNYFLQFVGEMSNIEVLRNEGKFIDGVTDINILKGQK